MPWEARGPSPNQHASDTPSTRGSARGGGSGGGPGGGLPPPGTAAVSKHETGTVTKQTTGAVYTHETGTVPEQTTGAVSTHETCVQARDMYCD